MSGGEDGSEFDVVLSPRELAGLAERDLSSTTCVVFDVLRATTTLLTALEAGAESVFPVSEVGEAIRVRAEDPCVLLAGERLGLRIGGALAGGVEFDFGNSPREFVRERVAGRRLVMTTTNGTRALRACAGAGAVVVGGLVNLGVLSEWIRHHAPGRLLLICSGTGEEVAMEDVAGAGGLAMRLSGWAGRPGVRRSDAWWLAERFYRSVAGDLVAGLREARNAARLLAMPELAPDVGICLAEDRLELVGVMGSDGRVRRG